MQVGNIELVFNQSITFRDIPRIKEATIIDVDSGALGNKFYFKNAKERKLANERYADFFHKNLVDGTDLSIYAALSSIEESLAQGKNVVLITSQENPHKNSHAKVVYEFINNKIKNGEIKYEISEGSN